MPTKGQVLSNPVTGDHYEFLETGRDTGGARVTLKATVKARGKTVPDHIHSVQDETFEVLSGQLTVWQSGHLSVLSAGQKILLSRNRPHNHYNNTDDPLVYKHTVSPALDFDYLVENLVGLAADGKSRNGKYGLMQELVILKYLDSKSFLADMPLGIQKMLMNILAPLGRLLGYRAIYKKYSGIEK